MFLLYFFISTGKEVTRRWTNLRDAFSKSRRRVQSKKKSGAGAVAVKKYVFNDQMQFLQKCYESRDTAESLDDSVAAENPEAVDEQPEEVTEVVTEVTAPQTQRIANRKRRKPDEVELQMLKALQQPEQQPDSHTSFLYSLLPYLKSFDQSETLEFQVNVLKTISKITERKRMAQPPPVPLHSQQYYVPHAQPHYSEPAFTQPPTIHPPPTIPPPSTIQPPPSQASHSRPPQQTTFSGFLNQAHTSNTFDNYAQSPTDNNTGTFSPTAWSESSENIDFSSSVD